MPTRPALFFMDVDAPSAAHGVARQRRHLVPRPRVPWILAVIEVGSLRAGDDHGIARLERRQQQPAAREARTLVGDRQVPGLRDVPEQVRRRERMTGYQRGDGNVVEQRVAQIACPPQLGSRLVGRGAEPAHRGRARQPGHRGDRWRHLDVTHDAGDQLDSGRERRGAELGHRSVGRRPQIARPPVQIHRVQRALVARHVDRRGPARGPGTTQGIAGRGLMHAVQWMQPEGRGAQVRHRMDSSSPRPVGTRRSIVTGRRRSRA
ncbi:MAG: hypothetical protein JWP83_2955 [Mycobacterium sp.]|jgi:hypothetical protein|nr:hypothetical protein [Mycobacterium sp.]